MDCQSYSFSVLQFHCEVYYTPVLGCVAYKKYLFQADGGRATEEEKAELFNVFPVTNINQNTFYRVEPLDLQLGLSYVVYVMGEYTFY